MPMSDEQYEKLSEQLHKYATTRGAIKQLQEMLTALSLVKQPPLPGLERRVEITLSVGLQDAETDPAEITFVVEHGDDPGEMSRQLADYVEEFAIRGVGILTEALKDV